MKTLKERYDISQKFIKDLYELKRSGDFIEINQDLSKDIINNTIYTKNFIMEIRLDTENIYFKMRNYYDIRNFFVNIKIKENIDMKNLVNKAFEYYSSDTEIILEDVLLSHMEA
jgi:hypothetical protein